MLAARRRYYHCTLWYNGHRHTPECARFLVEVYAVFRVQGTHAASANLSMSVSIQGLGPRFRLLISLANEGQDLATDLQVLATLALLCGLSH
jgi:hypothetical protein